MRRLTDVAERPANTSRGEAASPDALFEAVYAELRRLACGYLRDERPDHTLQATALVHEAYLRLVGGEPIEWHNRAQLFSIASQVMRHILVDHARKHAAVKRDHGAIRLSLDEAVDLAAGQNIDLVALDDALGALAALDPEQSQVVELRYFGGLSIPEIAGILGVAEITVSRRWKTAKLWLHNELGGGRRP
ncbi:MAG TPA: sigma-70 family RNA polymerase sigma factor [Vicinamibacterales bacterium]